MSNSDSHTHQLETFVGEWVGEERAFPPQAGPEGIKVTSRVVSRLALDDHFLLTDYVQQRSDGTVYRAHGVFGWNSQLQRYSMYWFDSEGWDAGGPATGHWDGDTLSLEHQHPMGHGRYTYRFEDPDNYELTLENSDDGQEWRVLIRGRFHRESR